MESTVNFDLLGGLSFDEWLEEEEKENATATPNERYVAVSNEELDNLEKSRNELTTVKSTNWAMKCFRDYLTNTKQDVDFATITKEELNKILRVFMVLWFY